ncbi:MAG TPA: hypothetical protein VES20_04900 [Bryobacteraceae bacterium]|nr:hypothetical protein [Bryobacteraceae bacterium]
MNVPAWFHAPLPPASTAVADHALELVHVIGHLPARYPLYHLGNNALHIGIYQRALQHPGVVVLHDVVLHHMMLGWLRQEEYISEFVYNFGSWSEEAAQQLWRERGRSAVHPRYFDFPMIRRVCESSVAVVVHNPAAARIVRKQVPTVPVHEIPLLNMPKAPARAVEALSLRLSFGLDPGRSLFGVFGYLRETKRIDTAIRACEAAGASLIVAGHCSRELAASLGPLLTRPHVRRVEFLPSAAYRALMYCVDGCINLRSPSTGETSAGGLDVMACGKPVLYTASGETERFPPGACVRVEPGLSEFDNLVDALVWLNRYRSDAREVGRSAAEYVRTCHGPAPVLERYAEVLT